MVMLTEVLRCLEKQLCTQPKRWVVFSTWCGPYWIGWWVDERNFHSSIITVGRLHEQICKMNFCIVSNDLSPEHSLAQFLHSSVAEASSLLWEHKLRGFADSQEPSWAFCWQPLCCVTPLPPLHSVSVTHIFVHTPVVYDSHPPYSRRFLIALLHQTYSKFWPHRVVKSCSTQNSVGLIFSETGLCDCH